MIRGYSDHAANERTFLAWVRTGIAVVAFGFVVEKFNLFMATVASSALGEVGRRLHLARGPFGHYEGLALIFGGVAIVVLATARFVRITWELGRRPITVGVAVIGRVEPDLRPPSNPTRFAAVFGRRWGYFGPPSSAPSVSYSIAEALIAAGKPP